MRTACTTGSRRRACRATGPTTTTPPPRPTRAWRSRPTARRVTPRRLARRPVQPRDHAVPAHRRARAARLRPVPRRRRVARQASDLRLLPPGGLQRHDRPESPHGGVPDRLHGLPHHDGLGWRAIRSRQRSGSRSTAASTRTSGAAAPPATPRRRTTRCSPVSAAMSTTRPAWMTSTGAGTAIGTTVRRATAAIRGGVMIVGASDLMAWRRWSGGAGGHGACADHLPHGRRPSTSTPDARTGWSRVTKSA